MWFSLTSFLSSRMAGGMAELTLRQEKFVQALTTPQTPTYCRPSAAYRTISPAIVPGAVHVGAFRMLRDDNVQQAIRGQLGLGQLGNKLKKCLRASEKLKDWPQVRETVMDYAKLTGQLVEKHEVKTDVGVSILVQRLLQEDRQARPRSVAADGHTLPDSDAESHTNRVEHPGISVAEPSASSEKSSSLLHPTAFVQ